MTVQLPGRVQSAWTRFWELLDSETVRLFVWPYYIELLVWGVYATVVAQPISIVEPVMGHAFYNFWVWTQIPATLFVLLGLTMRHGGKPVAEMGPVLLFRDWLGLWLQLGGHVCMGLMLAAYEYSGIRGAYWGQGAFSLFLVPAYVLGCLFLALQTGRKLWHGEQLHRDTNGHQ